MSKFLMDHLKFKFNKFVKVSFGSFIGISIPYGLFNAKI